MMAILINNELKDGNLPVEFFPLQIQLPEKKVTLRFEAAIRDGGQVQVRYYIWPSIPLAFSVGENNITKEVKRKEPVQLTDDYNKIEQELNLIKWPKDQPDPPMVRIFIEIQEISETGQPVRLSCTIPVVEPIRRGLAKPRTRRSRETRKTERTNQARNSAKKDKPED
jgi:hypothetical protein